jgi:hypothetical protein
VGRLFWVPAKPDIKAHFLFFKWWIGSFEPVLNLLIFFLKKNKRHLILLIQFLKNKCLSSAFKTVRNLHTKRVEEAQRSTASIFFEKTKI